MTEKHRFYSEAQPIPEDQPTKENLLGKVSFDAILEYDSTITNQFMKLTCSSKVHDCQGCSSPTSRSMSRGGFSESGFRSSVPDRSFKQIDSRLILNNPSLLSSMICGIIPMAAKMGAILLF